jgi:hypothetical protein
MLPLRPLLLIQIVARFSSRLSRYTAPFAELADDPRGAGVTPDAEPVEPVRLAAVSFDFDALDRLIRRSRRADPRRPPVARSDRPRRQAFHVDRQR